MTTVQKHLKTLATNKNNKLRIMLLGKIRKEILAWKISTACKRSAYRQALRVAGHTNEDHINSLAEAYI